MQVRRLAILAVAGATCLLSTVSFAQSAPPVADTMIYSSSPTTSYGTSSSLLLQTGGTTAVAYMQFSLATIPAGSTVTKATLRLFVDAVATPGSFDVYQINTSWSEGALIFNNAPPLGISATGNHPVAFTANTLNNFVLIDITALAQQWVNGTVINNGIALALTTSGGAVKFDSKEAVNTSHEPWQLR